MNTLLVVVLALLAARYLCAFLAKGADRFAWRRDFRSEDVITRLSGCDFAHAGFAPGDVVHLGTSSGPVEGVCESIDRCTIRVRIRGEIYMTRLQLLRSPWLDIYVNVIRTPDYDPFPHNHPWRRAWSLKLWNGYLEEIFWGPSLVFRHFRTPSRWSRVPEIHRIVKLHHDRPAVTLFVGAGRRGSWGFFDLDNGGKFIPHNARGQRGK